jgi:5-methylcytosine-specific restriction endonuclease McrA
LKGAKIERVDPFVVFERDGWRCQLCFDPTPKEKRGTHEDDAPELDHVVALADGGSHSYVNTQCACRRCNIEKGRRKDFVSAKIYALLG